MKIFMFVLFICVFSSTNARNNCRKEIRKLSYNKIISCHRSTLPVIFWGNANDLKDCENYARQKSGLGFNFSPPEVRNLNTGYTFTCQVLGCPEIAKSSTLIEDVGFDYYSAYGNWKSTENATCISSVGLFSLLTDVNNYTKSIDSCQKIGAEIADVTSELRTKELSRIVNDTLNSWYKTAYVGLDDIKQEGHFVTSFGMMLSCSTFRAWAPGHPIFDTINHDCVVLDDIKFWRVVDCRRKFAVLCEFFPEKPQQKDLDICNKITQKAKRRKCLKQQKHMANTMKNLTRAEQCAIQNAFYDTDTENNNI
ncbi:uncharacterized protein LOC114327222 [Diabrotica virgifera virgifera]|nr:uncharacterized protein LOC114327222 [Diabrotica virgifera virgifera]